MPGSAGEIQLWFQGTDTAATTQLLVDIVGYYVAGAAGPLGLSAWDNSTSTGSATAPTAPPGKVCIYPVLSSSLITSARGDAGRTSPTVGFTVVVTSGAAAGDIFLVAAWAYTAP